MNALADPRVGDYISKNFVSSFQKVATFTIVGGAKQGGNVASYFCAPDGRVLHCVAGPVDADTMLAEAKWVVDSVKKAMKINEEEGTPFKALIRQWHAERLRKNHGIIVQPVTFDPPEEQDPEDPLSYRDPTGRPLVPVLPPPPIDGPDVQFRELRAAAELAAEADESFAPLLRDRKGRRVQLGNLGRVHQIMAAHAMVKIERIYGTIFENILGEKVTTDPVLTINARGANRQDLCLRCGFSR